MLTSRLSTELHQRFVWDLLGEEAGLFQGYGWRQSMLLAVNQLRIWSDPQPDFLHLGAHGLQAQQIDGGICLITRQYCDARQVQITVATHLDHIAILLLQGGSHKIGVATDALLDELQRQQLITKIVERHYVHR